jgi:hypothetical protein
MADKDNGTWDSVDERTGYREQIGSQRYEDNGQDAATSGADQAAALSMPEESLPADDSRSFREQLPAQDGATVSGDMATDADFEMAAKEQLEDEDE